MVRVVSLLATLVVTPLCRAVAIRLSVVAVPTEWAVHSRPIPYLGGVAMLVGFLAALGVAWASGQFGPGFDGLTVPMGWRRARWSCARWARSTMCETCRPRPRPRG